MLKVAQFKITSASSTVVKMNKVVFIYARLVKDTEAYEGKTNADIEKEILEEIAPIPYVARIEKVTVLDCQT